MPFLNQLKVGLFVILITVVNWMSASLLRKPWPILGLMKKRKKLFLDKEDKL